MGQSIDRAGAWSGSPERRELRALYSEADALMANFSCDASTDCCRFGVTGREPYVTAAEVAEIRDAVRARGYRVSGKRSLPLAGERRCPLFSDEARCTVYDARPLGCRTFFCQAAIAKSGGAKVPRAELGRIAREIEEISRRAFPSESGTRPLTRYF